MQRPTIRDVAARAGVSVSTVSRVLGGKSDVAGPTKDAIDRVISELGFEPRRSSRRGRPNQSQALALVMADFGKFRTEESGIVMGAAIAAASRGYPFTVVTEEIDRTDLLQLYRAGQVGGVILTGLQLSDWRVDLLQQHGLPFVTFGRPRDTEGVNFVDLDDEAAIDHMVGYLVGLGHSEIGFVSRSRNDVKMLGTASRLQRGIELAIARHKVAGRVVNTDLNTPAASQAVRQLLGRYRDITAIVTLNGVGAVGALDTLDELGLRVPHDVSVVSLVTETPFALIRPRLTAVVYSNTESGDLAASLLARLIEEPPASRDHHVEQMLVAPAVTIRSTSGPPP